MPATGSSSPGETAIRLVVFDLGRVLLRISDDWDHAARLAGHPQLTGLTGDLSTASSRGEHRRLAELLDRFETGKVSVLDFFAEASTLAGHAADDLQAVMDAVLIEAYPGVGEMLDRLAALPVLTACLSNTNARHWELLTDPAHRAFLPLDKLDFAFASQQVGHAKPHPEIYAHVESATGCRPVEILFFDDRPENIEAAAQRGWKAVPVDDHDDPLPTIVAGLTRYGVLSTP